MHSFVARLRARAISQTTTTSTQSEEPPPHTPDTPTSGPSVQPVPESASVHQALVDRKIMPQVHELLNSYSTEESPSQGLSPRPVKLRSPVHHTPLWEESPEGEISRTDERSDSPASTSQRSLGIGRGSFARLSQRLASSGPWSTFGRMKDPSTARLSQLEHPPSSRRFYLGSVDTFAMPRRSRSSRSVAAYTASSSVSVDHLRRPSRASEASSWMHPQSMISSHRRSFSLSAIHQDMDEPIVHPATPSSPPTSSSGKGSAKPSITAQSSVSTHSQAVSVHTPVLQIFDDNTTTANSPGTFGQPSPPLRLSAFASSASSPTLLPAFEHPEIPLPPVSHSSELTLPRKLHSSRSRPTLRDRSNTVRTPPLRHWTSSLHAKTFPPRKRGKSVGCNPDENSVPLPATSGHRLRTYASMPGVRHLFDQQPPSRASISRRESSKSSRRVSADWNARQATSGVQPGATGEYGWPAEVSKEMIRLSLSESREKAVGGKAGRRETRGSANADITQRVHNVPRSSDDVAGRPCSPLFSPNSPPLSIEGTSESGDKRSWSHPQDNFSESSKSGGVVEGMGSMSVRNGVPLSTLKEDMDDMRQPETLPRAATGTRGYRKSILRQSSSLDAQGPEAGPSSLQHGPFVTPTPSRRSSLRQPARHASEPTLTQVPETPTKKGKRKAEDIDLTFPDPRTSHHATFLIPADHRRTHHQSEPSRAPSAYQRKRVRLSSSSPASSPSRSRPGSAQPSVSGTPSSRLSNPPPSPAIRALSRAASTRSMQPSVGSAAPSANASRRDRRRSISEISFPVGAIVSPQPPSLSRSSTYHMRDPRRPARIQPTPWGPHFKSEDEHGSPIHAWIFFVGFVLFPLWWIASFLPIPRTRQMGGSDTEKAVVLDDPQIEHDARTWRFRCRVVAGISFLTYIPFIVLVAVFTTR